jgi:hypothetical protein
MIAVGSFDGRSNHGKINCPAAEPRGILKAMKKIIYIIGIGGRTGAMFCREFQGGCDIVGVGLERETAMIARGSLKLSRGGLAPEALKVEAVCPDDFAAAIKKKYPDFIWIATRNPVTEAVKFYYRNFKGKKDIPALVLSQNGLSAIGDARAALSEVMGQEADNVRIIRVSLINGIDLKMENEKMGQAAFASAEVSASQSEASIISYKLPIRLGFGALAGTAADMKEILGSAQIKAQEFEGADVLKMENSKLFTNLIGMAAAANGMTVGAGFRDKGMFKMEVAMLREYVLAARAGRRGFLDNYAGYPIKLLAEIMLLPPGLLMPFRGLFERIVAKGRNRPKDLSEIDYYNGEAVKLGRRYGVPTPVNEAAVAKVKNQKP